VAVDGPSGERDAPDEQPVREVPQAHDAPHDPDQPELLKAVGELAAENADLYRKIGELTHALKTEQGRFGTWAKEVARDREQAAQDKAQMAERLDKVLAMNEALAHRVADLEQERADQSPARAHPSGGSGRRRAPHARRTGSTYGG
jgi:cell division septum initiation protein DivIVA